MIVYNIGKAWCSLIFHQVKASPTELVTNIWLDMVHTLKGQWDGIVGDFDAKTAQRHKVSYRVESYSIHDLQVWHSFLALSTSQMVVSSTDHIEFKIL